MPLNARCYSAREIHMLPRFGIALERVLLRQENPKEAEMRYAKNAARE